ncbi:MAG: LamG domain-containing protein, partial [Spirochaetota bacterium]|nr:LamG domain-containing protein [Spirochaetota bacterium]
TMTAAIIDNTNNLTIGVRSVSTDAFMGQIGEIIIYNKTLSSTEQKQVECDVAGRFALTVTGC